MGQRENRDDFKVRAGRSHFLTKQDCKNCLKPINDVMLGIRHKEDTVSVSLLVSELQQEKYNPVTVYKAYGRTSATLPELHQDAFLLGIMTETQKSALEEHGEKILCMDSTHNTTQYKEFKLLTLMVSDDYGEGNTTP